MEPIEAQRSTTSQYLSTPLRGAFDHAPYFHDGSAATLAESGGVLEVAVDHGS